MSFEARTLTNAAGETLHAQMRARTLSAAVEGNFNLKQRETLTDDEGVVWVVRDVKNADVAKGQPPYCWAELAIKPATEAKAPRIKSPVVEAVEDDAEDDDGQVDIEDVIEAPAPAPKRKRKGADDAAE